MTKLSFAGNFLAAFLFAAPCCAYFPDAGVKEGEWVVVSDRCQIVPDPSYRVRPLARCRIGERFIVKDSRSVAAEGEGSETWLNVQLGEHMGWLPEKDAVPAANYTTNYRLKLRKEHQRRNPWCVNELKAFQGIWRGEMRVLTSSVKRERVVEVCLDTLYPIEYGGEGYEIKSVSQAGAQVNVEGISPHDSRLFTFVKTGEGVEFRVIDEGSESVGSLKLLPRVNELPVAFRKVISWESGKSSEESGPLHINLCQLPVAVKYRMVGSVWTEKSNAVFILHGSLSTSLFIELDEYEYPFMEIEFREKTDHVEFSSNRTGEATVESCREP